MDMTIEPEAAAEPEGAIEPPALLDDARRCPWCGRWALKDDACNWVTCGLSCEGFVVGAGCGHQFCFLCQGKLCGLLYDADTGLQNPGVPTVHSAECCTLDSTNQGPICPGGHNSHK
jgi:hypothetical protein